MGIAAGGELCFKRLVGLAVIASRRGDLRYALPYGTFLALAAMIASLYGDRIVAWYVGFYVR